MSEKKPSRTAIKPFSPSDPLAREHELVARLVSQHSKLPRSYSYEIDLSATPAGEEILAADAKQAVRIVSALVAHASYFDGLRAQIKATAIASGANAAGPGGGPWQNNPEFQSAWPLRQVSAQALRRLLRRKLPLESSQLTALAEWIAAADWQSDSLYPLNAFVKAMEIHGPPDEDDHLLRAALARVNKAFREDSGKDIPKLAQRIENLLSQAEDPTDPASFNAELYPPAPELPKPAPVGSDTILTALKVFLRIQPEDAAIQWETIGLDRFALRTDSPLRDEHELINILLTDVVEQPGYHNPDLSKSSAGRAMLARQAAGHGLLLLAMAERCAHSQLVTAGMADHRVWQSRHALGACLSRLLQRRAQLDRNALFDLLLFVSVLGYRPDLISAGWMDRFIAEAEQHTRQHPLTPGERHVLHRVRCQLVRTAPFGHPGADVSRIDQLLQDGMFLALVPGEAWSDEVNTELSARAPAAREPWLNLLRHAASATGSRPSAKWLKSAKAALQGVGARGLSEALLRWFPLVNLPRTIPMLGSSAGSADSAGAIHEDNATCLRGLLWLAPQITSPDLIRAIGALTISCYRKIPGVGPRAVKVANAGVYALSQIQDLLAVGQLAWLKIKVKFGSAQKEIDKAFTLAAERTGLPREELEEMSVPTYGLQEVGLGEEKIGDYTARLTVTGTDSTELVWVKPDGRIQRAIPAELKTTYRDEVKEQQAAAKDIQKMLPAQRDRIDGLFLQQRTWPMAVWRERYLDHALLGTLARRLLWEFTEHDRAVTGIWFEGRLVDLDLQPIEAADPEATVRLWHPIGKNPDEVAAWRAWLETQQVQQPFKQAHREIYLLTAAELQTRLYSNRYAAHVIKQHQFNALCAVRGWKNQLRLMVDADYSPPSLLLPQWGLRAEFWVEGIGQDYGTDTNESGTFLRLSTDQVRFYRLDAPQRAAHAHGGGYQPEYRGQDAEPLPLDQIPPLVFSEVMRDVDLFVGVSSVGNDPTWADGGPDGRHLGYWQNFSFGELNASADTRKAVLQRLVPKLKIAGACRFEERFLIVQGSLRTYKIHLGSGNILMEPNHQYLCIVPKQGDAQDSSVLLPFEGDRTLSVILSKAFLLANDTRITDPTIVSQITR